MAEVVTQTAEAVEERGLFVPPGGGGGAVAGGAGEAGGAGRLLRLYVPVTEGRAHRYAVASESEALEIGRAAKDGVVKAHCVLPVDIVLPPGVVAAGGDGGGA